jgi:peptidoglycan/LPS O-acetylase OafA/YrhL
MDGLRGVASLIVVMCHCMLISTVFASSVYGPVTARRGSWAWWVSETPLHTFWDGTPAVVVFFVLSGFVLVAPRLHRSGGWLGYYPKRMLRLYLPTLAAVGLAVLWTYAAHRQPIVGASRLLNANHAVDGAGVLRDMELVRGANSLDSPLWSLRYEVLFSLLLPAYVWFARVAPRWWLVKILGTLAIIGYGFQAGHTSTWAMAIFALGAVLAAHAHRIATVLRHPGLWLVAGVVLVNGTVMTTIDGIPSHAFAVSAVSYGAVAAGALLLVAVMLTGGRVAGWFETRPAKWLGERSFSLYLVHEPLLIAVALWFHGQVNTGLLLAIVVPASLLLASLFRKLVEKPCHQLAQATGATIDRAEVAVKRWWRHGSVPSGAVPAP